ncbi:hypothetical protein E1263_35220 [Kribbella antibiotica]|uniref:Ricin B lectin domain-containing protein n=1 Tax=Kribbella antibiotica TaxID=190195 RepID=A0A4R4YPU0_9ACTN|nr:RICIN domain-containing protein [Kribbella antibiotica]TDD47123.1 hypothetical protein E1263_35220 [Kribbella antibiotica]
MRSPRTPGKTAKTSSSRFADTFAQRPDLPRVSRMPDRRAWSATLLVTGFVAGIAFAIPALMHSGGGNAPVYAADAPLVGRTPAGAVPTPGKSITTVLRPGVTVTLPPATVTIPGKNTTMVVTVPGKNLTATITLPPATTTTTATTTATATTTTTTKTTTTVKVPDSNKTAEGVTRPPALGAQQQPMKLMSDDTNRCVDVKDAGDGVGRDGTPLIAWECTGNANQSWSFQPDGSIRSMGLCMDLANAQSADGTQIQLANCNNGWAQKFQLTDKRELMNPNTHKCVTAGSGDKGASLILRSCTGAPVQKWHNR